MKYLAFIDSLLVILEESGLCCIICGLNIFPLGYADDVAAASISKNRTDQILDIVFKHSCKWRYKFNPKKSAVLVYGESLYERKRNAENRIYRLGKHQIKEQCKYEHLGLTNYVDESFNDRVQEKVRKGRKAMNAAAGIGLKPGGITIYACSILFWAMIVPITTFSCELWVLSDNDIKILEEFQRYSGRPIQRFHYKSLNQTSYSGLGWIRLDIYIYVKKVLFIRGIAILPPESLYRKVFMSRIVEYDTNKESAMINANNSPIFDMIRVSDLFGLYNEVKSMILDNCYYSKGQWKQIVWNRAWGIERQDWAIRASLFRSTKTINTISDPGSLLIWWQLAGFAPAIMRQCEVMSKIVCNASNLKIDCYQFRKDPAKNTYCDLCNNFSVEDARHVIMHCPILNDLRNELFNGIRCFEHENGVIFLRERSDVLAIILGQHINGIDPMIHAAFLKHVAKCVYKMYNFVLRERSGIG